jgi:hypothetical protein
MIALLSISRLFVSFNLIYATQFSQKQIENYKKNEVFMEMLPKPTFNQGYVYMMSALYMMKLTIIYNTCTVYAITSAAFYFGLRNMLFLLFYYMMEIYYLSGYNRIVTLNNIIIFKYDLRFLFFVIREV